MMPELGKYADTIMSAYAATIILMGVLIVLSIARARKVKKQLAEIEARRNG
jgi:heme exporter protein D